MDNMELKSLAEEIRKEFTGLRGEVEAVKSRDVVTEDKLSKMADEVTRKMEALQQEQAKMRAAIERPGNGSSDDEAKARHAAAWGGYLRRGVAGEGFKVTDTDGIEVRAMSTNVQPDGGYLVRPQFADWVVDRIFETSPVMQVARVEDISTASIQAIVDDNEAGARWVSQGPSGGQTTTPQIGQIEITAHKLEADPRVTTETLEDAVWDVESWLRAKVADKFAREHNTAFVNGTGVGQPRGFMTYPDLTTPGTYQRARVEQVITGAAANITADGAITLQNSLKEAYQASAVWGMKRTTFGEFLKQKGADNYFFGPVLLRDGQSSMTLLGKPVVFMDDLPPVGAGALAVVYGDFSRAYTVVRRVGIQVLRDPYTNKGFVTYYTTMRVGGDVTNYEAIKISRCAAP